MGHSSLTFKFTLETQHLNTGTPRIQGERPEEWGLACWSKILPRLLVMVTGLSEVSTNQCFALLLSQLISCSSFGNAVPKRAATAFNLKDAHFHAEKLQGLLHPFYDSAKQDVCTQN